jgi:hypothetical protein
MRSTRDEAPPFCAAVCLSTEDPVCLGAALVLNSGDSTVCIAGSRGAVLSTPPG